MKRVLAAAFVLAFLGCSTMVMADDAAAPATTPVAAAAPAKPAKSAKKVKHVKKAAKKAAEKPAAAAETPAPAAK